MNCPKCKSENVYCKDTRKDADSIKRRKHCVDCGYRFSTIEITAATWQELKKGRQQENGKA